MINKKLGNNKNIPNSLEEKFKFLGILINKDCDFLQNIQLCEPTVSKVNKLCIKNQSFLLNEENNKKEISNEMEDCISLLFKDIETIY